MKVLKNKKQMSQDDILYEVIGLLKFTCEVNILINIASNIIYCLYKSLKLLKKLDFSNPHKTE